MGIINVHFFSQSYLKTIVCYYSLDFFLRFACRRIFQSNFSPFLYAKAKSFDKQQNVFSAFAVVLVVLGICIIFDWASTERKHFTTKIRVPPILSQELVASKSLQFVWLRMSIEKPILTVNTYLCTVSLCVSTLIEIIWSN